MGRIYYSGFDDIQVTTDNDQDIWEILAITNKCILHGFEMTSELLAAESVDLALVRRSGGGNGSAAGEEQRSPDDAGPLASIEQLATLPGTLDGVLMGFKWEQLGPVGHIFTPEMRPVADAGEALCLHCGNGPSGTTGWSGWLCWEEV